DYYVARDGDDLNPGTESAPWRTIQKAADTLAPGDTAFVRAGKYKERVTVNVSGSATAGFVTIRNFPGEKPIVDGRGKVPPKNEDTGLFLIADQSYVAIHGFEIRNYKAARGSRVPAGIFVIGECDHIEIRDNEIHRIKYNSRKGNAFGIVIYGTSAAHPITRVIIDGNEVHHCKLGNSETIALNGNVTDFEVTRNVVHDNNNLGIVFIGFEGSCPDPAQDQARNGVCRENIVSNISSFGNPAYGREYSAGGIYVDGGARILIERNVSCRNDIGIELASEHAGRVTSGVIVRDNLIYENKIGGLFMGGYDTQRGATEDCAITNNTFVGNDTKKFGNGEIYLQHFVTGVQVTQNIVLAGTQSLLIGNPTTTNSGNVFDYNLYFAPDGGNDSAWQWLKNNARGFTAWRAASGQDEHSIFDDPLLVDPSGGNFHLAPNSPAIDAGDPAFVPDIDESDIDGDPRPRGPRVDLGADEI
ncbi:MAG: choice-of-anchor Q domain-containing protein, partial [Chthoniobacteraceae bacterium]